ncbi:MULTISPECIES: TetR/AcrR family transcriptional regulator [unclassified Marinomonas]|uniref:TetR/AcrR family transcriptional regulator n=1 Tax=unclassified Marinomonas TaxID=196814 RepID=UPI0007AFB5B8|nr:MULTISPECIES: TetR family transcriptional regulator [unclassified Marinomonas]
MPRKKNYVREEAILKAREAFRRNGYLNFGIKNIEEQIGLGRFAIRTQFDGKEGLFEEALRSYQVDAKDFIIAPIANAESIDVFEKMLIRTIAPVNLDSRKYGCLFVNTLAENISIHNPNIDKFPAEHYQGVKSATIDLIKREQSLGKVKSCINPEDAGDFIVGCFLAIGLINRNAEDGTAAEGYVNIAISTVKSWKENS